MTFYDLTDFCLSLKSQKRHDSEFVLQKGIENVKFDHAFTIDIPKKVLS